MQVLQTDPSCGRRMRERRLQRCAQLRWELHEYSQTIMYGKHNLAATQGNAVRTSGSNGYLVRWAYWH